MRLVGDVEDDHAAVDIAHVHAVGPLRIDVGVVRPVAGVDAGAGVARRRRDIVALVGAGQPPAADLDRLRRVAHVDALVELVVVRVRRVKVARRRNSCGCIRRRRTTAGGRRASSGRSGRKTRSASGFPGSRCRTARRPPAGPRSAASDRRSPGCRRPSPASWSACGCAAGRRARRSSASSGR